MTNLIYFSNVTQNTHRFVCDLGIDALRIPLVYKGETLALEPFVLITPTYGLGKGDKNFVPPQVRKFLNNADNSSLLRGVIAAGNANFGEEFALAGKIISRRFDVPYLYRFELRGNDADVKNIRAGLEMFWEQQKKIENNQDAVLGV